ncbi:MAG: 50S ribosomal protein L9 [Candidatus Gracilibacteria bacterium]|nr:50S ribosomal protein L9 [Candidatus Gracilibacteria bacterium]
MKVLFLQNVIHVAKAGEIKDVKPGYAANMLFPKNLAKELTPEIEQQYKNQLKKEDFHRRELLENRHNLTDILNGKEFIFTLKTGVNDKVYGAIGEKDIIQAVKKKHKIELSKKHVLLDGHIKTLGETTVFIKLGKGSQAKIKVIINAE